MTALKWTKRILKWFFGTILALVLLISGALYIFEDDIIDYAVSEINSHLKAEVQISKVELSFWSTFPDLSINFSDVFIQDALPNSTYKDTLLYSEMIQLKFDPLEIWDENYNLKKCSVSKGTLQLKVNEAAEINYDILQPTDSKSDKALKLDLKAIDISNLRFSYSNAIQEQTVSTTFKEVYLSGQFNDDQFVLKTNAKFDIHSIQTGLVPFVLNQTAESNVSILVDRTRKTVSLPNGKVSLSGLPFAINLLIDSTSVHLALNAKNLQLQDVANRLALSEVDEIGKYKGKGVANFSLNLDSNLGPEAIPEIQCKFDIQDGSLTIPNESIALNELNLDGYFSSVEGKGTEELSLNNISFRTSSGSFSGNLLLQQFNAPVYIGDAKGMIDLEVIHGLFHIPKIDQLSGKINVDTHFKLSTLNTETGNEIRIDEGNGIIDLEQVALQLTDDTRKFKQINGRLVLDKRQAGLENCSLTIGKSDLVLNGLFDRIDGFLQNNSTLRVSVTAQSNRIELDDFTNTFAGAATKSNTLDWMLPTQIDGDVRLDVADMKLNQHHFTQIRGNMLVGNRTISINQLHGVSAQAAVSGSLSIIETAPEYFQLATNLSSSNIQFNPLFQEWNNFDQHMIEAKNIAGQAEVILDLKAPFSIGNGIVKEDIKAQIQVKITEGVLRNVAAFKLLTADLKTAKTRLILRPDEVRVLESKLDNLSFATLENTIYIVNSKIIIPKMEIKSNALDITAEGTHSFDNWVDYKFSFRLRELKKLKDESEFGEVIDDRTGVRIYVRMFGDLNSPTIQWDQTSRKQKGKENREEAKNEAISILKSEFGLFKKDTTIKSYQPKTVQKESLKIEFGKEETVDPVQESKKTNAFLNSIKEKTKKLKEQQEREKENGFTVD